jgi:hypothetical protein
LAVPRVLLVAALVLALTGCARPSGRTAEVHGPDGGRFHATVYHFLAATNDYDRACYVHDGDEFRDDMGWHFAVRPREERVRVDAVEAEGDGIATVTALVGYAAGTYALGRSAQAYFFRGEVHPPAEFREEREGVASGLDPQNS